MARLLNRMTRIFSTTLLSLYRKQRGWEQYVSFSKDKSVFAVPLPVIQSYVRMSHQLKGKKSIPRADFDIYWYLVEQIERAPIDYLQYVDEAVTPVMFDSMIQFDEDHKKVANNIEAAKEKMANKKRKLLKA